MIVNIPLKDIRPNPWQTRQGGLDPVYIEELAMDIAARGLLQTPIGRWVEDHNIQLAFGHNRLAAFQFLADRDASLDDKVGWDVMPVDVRDLTDEQMAELAWAENEKRRDVTPIERALAIQHRMTDFGWNQAQAAEHLGIDRSTVSNILRLLRLPERIQQALSRGEISERAAVSLLPMYDLPEHILTQANRDYYATPLTIENGAINGRFSSDELRSQVNHLRDRYTRRLQDAEFHLDAIFPEGIVLGYDGAEGGAVYNGSCRACDRRLKETGNICLDRNCFDAKTVLYRRKYLAEAAYAASIEVIDPNKGGQPTQFETWKTDQTRSILATKCDNLRLVYTASKHEADDPRIVPGHPHALIVCDKRNGSCSCLKGMELAAKHPKPKADPEPDPVWNDTPDPSKAVPDPRFSTEPVCAQTDPLAPPTAAQLEEIARQARRDKRDVPAAHRELIERLTSLAVEWLRYDEPGAFYVLIRHYAYPNAKELDIEKIYRRAAGEIARSIAGADNDDSVEEMYQMVNRRLEALNLPTIGQEKTLVEIFQEQETEV